MFTAVRVIPAEGRVEARGKFVRRKEGKGEGLEKGDLELEKSEEKSEEVEEGSPPKKIKLDVDAGGEGGELASGAGGIAEEKA